MHTEALDTKFGNPSLNNLAVFLVPRSGNGAKKFFRRALKWSESSATAYLPCVSLHICLQIYISALIDSMDTRIESFLRSFTIPVVIISDNDTGSHVVNDVYKIRISLDVTSWDDGILVNILYAMDRPFCNEGSPFRSKLPRSISLSAERQSEAEW
jgi:hypothetical protein